MKNMTVNVYGKTSAWFKPTLKVLAMLTRLKLINIDKCICLLNVAVKHMFKYRVGKGRWRQLKGNIRLSKI